jgi:dTDP-4-amino-4,6-dideoxygalactose transaminase
VSGRPAIAGGAPVRDRLLALAAPAIGEAEIAAVVDTLRSGWLTTGPRTAEFERRFADYVGATHAVAVTSGTAALRLGLWTADVGPGDEVVTSALTYVATVHEIVRRGARPVLADVDRRTFVLDPDHVASLVTPRTRALVPVHFAGRPCAMDALAGIAERHGLEIVDDAAHAIETMRAGRSIARWAGASAFSFHPAKNLTTGEGGMLATDDESRARRARRLRLHGIARDAWARRAGGDAEFDVDEPGDKCNMSDIQAAIGIPQLERLDESLIRRTRLCTVYRDGLARVPGIAVPPLAAPGDRHAWHMFNVVVEPERLGIDRDALRRALRAENVETGHHYPALHRTTLYRRLLGRTDADLPNASWLADRILTLPLHPAMTDEDAASVVTALARIAEYHA